MKNIYNGLKDGDSKQRLAIVSDLFSILGVSAAAVAVGLFKHSYSINIGRFVDASISTIVAIGFLLLLFVGLGWLVDRVESAPSFPKTRKLALVGVIWLAFTACILIAGRVGVEFWMSAHAFR